METILFWPDPAKYTLSIDFVKISIFCIYLRISKKNKIIIIRAKTQHHYKSLLFNKIEIHDFPTLL